jgi:hypothetical protein
MGALVHALIASRYALPRAGHVLLSINNKPVSDAIPLFAPVVSPLAQGFNPLLAQLAASPLRGGVEQLRAQLRDAAPPAVREALPLLDQLEPLTLDLAAGRREFTPSPAETQKLLAAYYSTPRTLLIRFKDDTIDETPLFAQTLLTRTAEGMEVSVSTLSGDHVRPLQQPLPSPPPEVLDAAMQGEAALTAMSSFAAQIGAPAFPLSALRDSVRASVQTLQSQSAGAEVQEGGGGSLQLADIRALSAHIVAWMERTPANV